MAREIVITAGSVSARAELLENATADAIWEALPIEEAASTWGDEIYFSLDADIPEGDTQATVALGDLGLWAPGNAFCIFFGLTPMSRGKEIRPASPVTVFGKLQGDPKVFKKVHGGTPVHIERG